MKLSAKPQLLELTARTTVVAEQDREERKLVSKTSVMARSTKLLNQGCQSQEAMGPLEDGGRLHLLVAEMVVACLSLYRTQIMAKVIIASPPAAV